jgi:Nickel responsive protein SCO4226-like
LGNEVAQSEREGAMPQFVIERELPGAGRLSPAELRQLALRSCKVLDGLGPAIRWMHSYVTGGKLYCLYEAPSEALILRHAALAGVPITRTATVIDPVAAWSQGQGAA